MGAQKLIFGLQALITPLSSAVFPITSTLSKHSIEEANKFVKKLILYTIAVMFVGVNILGYYAEDIVKLLLGAEFKASAKVLEIMAVGPLFVALSVIIANHILIVRGHASRLKNLYFVIAIIATMVSYPLVRDYHAIGAAWLYVIVEFAVFLGLVWISRDIKLELEKAPRDNA
jgi:PST family polysaccharide transporter